MRYVDIKSAKRISKIGLGTWQFGAREWGYGERYARLEAQAIVRRALELGVTLFDTAEMYGAGNSERILGRALGDSRESVFLATKIFPIIPAAQVVVQRGTASARRLGVPYLDLYQIHWPNPLVRDSTTMRGMRSLQQIGLVGEVGVGDHSLGGWLAAEDALGSRVLSNQVEYSLVVRSPERSLIPFAESHDRVIIAFAPLAQGLLSGNYHSASRPTNRVRSASSLFSAENIERTRELTALLREVAAGHDASCSQIALAWTIRCLAVVAIPGASSVEQLESNVAAADINLADDEYEALNRASAQFRATGVGPESPRLNVTTLKHLARCSGYVARTVQEDCKLRLGRRVGVTRTNEQNEGSAAHR